MKFKYAILKNHIYYLIPLTLMLVMLLTWTSIYAVDGPTELNVNFMMFLIFLFIAALWFYRKFKIYIPSLLLMVLCTLGVVNQIFILTR